MKFFSKKETTIVVIILAVVFTLSYFNYQVALRRGRDNERENDLGDLTKLLDDYKNKNSIYPKNLSDLARPPRDPSSDKGRSYLYFTNGKLFQLYASLEGGQDESLYDPHLESLGLKCGQFICNFGKSSNIPLDKSIEEYENEINAKTKTN